MHLCVCDGAGEPLFRAQIVDFVFDSMTPVIVMQAVRMKRSVLHRLLHPPA